MKKNLPGQISGTTLNNYSNHSFRCLKLLVILNFLLPMSVFSQTIGTTSFTDIGPAGNKINSATPVNYTLDNWLFTASASSGNASISAVSSNAESLSNDFAVSCVRSTTTGGAYLLYGSFKATTLTGFKLNNFRYRYSVAAGGTSLATITIAGYKNGSAVPGATVDYAGISPVNSNTAWNTADVSANSNFNNVDEIRLSGSGGDGTFTIAWFDAINISNATSSGTPLSASVGAQTNVACNGGSNGSATVNVTGGTAPYSYSWSPSGGTAATASGLSAGNYTVTITDAASATTTQNFTITQPSALSSSGAQTNIACNGTSTGSAAVSVSGGTAPYSYSWRNNTAGSTLPQTTATINGLYAGSYTVTIADANGCTTSRSFNLTQPSALTTTGSQTNVTTSGGSDGSATVSVSGGSPGYTYSWSPSGGTAATASGLSAGTYRVTITDANGCTATKDYTITQPAAITAAPVVTAPANGSMSNNPTPAYNGTAPAGSTVTVYVDAVSIGTSTASGGSFSLTQPTALADGSHTIYATAQSSGQSVSANSNTNTFTIDGTAPAAPVVVTPANGSVTNNNTPIVSGTAEAGATVTLYDSDGTTVLATTAADGSGNWQASSSALVEGSHTLTAKAKDAAGNTSRVSNPNTITIDRTAPSVAISSTASGNTTNSTIPVTATFSESVTGFIASDVTVTGGTLSGFSGSGSNYSFTVTANAAGTVTVNIAANVAQDAAGNGNTAASPFSISYTQQLTAAPVVIIPANGSMTSTTTPTYAGTAPANSVITVYVDGAALGSATTATSSGNWAITQPVALSQGSHTVYARAQSSGSSVSANSNTNTFTVDTQRPSVMISSTAGASGSSTSTSPIPYTVTFSESVTGFVAGDVTPGNATISGFSGSGTTYTFNATPAANGAVTINIAANVSMDAAGNGNTAASQFSSIYAPLSGNADLSNLAISAGTFLPGFASGTTSYAAAVSNATTSLAVTPTVSDANASVTVNGTSVTSGNASGSIALNVGSNTITVQVTAQNSSTKAYTLTVTRGAASTNADLSNLTVSAGTLSPAFASGTTSYTSSVSNGTTSLTITPTVSNANATVTINGVTVSSGNTSGAIALNVGSNTITTLVTAQDGSTTKTYTLTVTRTANANADLAALSLSSGTLTPAFVSGTTSYTASVSNSTTSLTVIPAVSNANASVTVNGTPVTSGNVSGAIALNAGSNTITTIVTAQDGSTTKTYTLTVTRAQASQAITFAALPAKNYGDPDFTLNATASSGLPVSYTSSDATIATVSGSNITIHKAGRVTLTASQAGDANYQPAFPVSTTLVINPKTLAATLVGAVSKVYDGNNIASFNNSNFTLTGKIGNDDVALTYPSTGVYYGSSVNARTIVNANGLSLSGANKANYVLSSANLYSLIGTITPAPVQVNLAGTVSKVYNGTTAATLTDANYQLTGIIGNDQVSINNPVSGNYDNPGAGTNKVISVSGIVLSGPAASNYLLSATNVSANIGNISPKALTVTADNKTKNYGEANPVLTLSYDGFVSGETSAVLTTLPVVTTTASTASSAGIYPIAISGATAANYSITYVPGTLTVTAATPASITFSATGLYENQPAGTLAGTLTAFSANPNAVFAYRFVNGIGDADNALFSIAGNKLLTSSTFNYEAKNTYNVRLRATDQNGLFLDQVFVIRILDVNEAPTLTAIADQRLCYSTAMQGVTLTNITPGPESAQNVTLTVTSSNPGLFNNLNVSALVNGTAMLNYQLATTGTAIVTVKVQDNGGRDNGGTDSFSQSFTISAAALPLVAIDSDKGIQIAKGEIVTLTATGGTSYIWDTVPNVSGGISSAMIKVRPDKTTTYRVTPANSNGCNSLASITIQVKDDYSKLQVANILTPNGDGKNDTWIIKNIDLYPNNTVSIFDRGGRKLIEVKHYDNSWDGTFHGTPLAEGTYYYVIDFGPGIAPFKGFITILRNR